MKKKDLKSLKISKKTISNLSIEKAKGGTWNFLSFNNGLYCGAGPTTSLGHMACEVACICFDDEY